jgi:hypothetical protein
MSISNRAGPLRGKAALALSLISLFAALFFCYWVLREPAADAVEPPAPAALPADDDDPKLDFGVSRSSIEKRRRRRARIEALPLD